VQSKLSFNRTRWGSAARFCIGVNGVGVEFICDEHRKIDSELTPVFSAFASLGAGERGR
jgi:hypothetical protein